MAQTITEKIFSSHIGKKVYADDIVTSPIDMIDLLTELNKDDSRYTNKNIKNHIKSKKNRHFSFKDKLKIYINYLTAYVGDDGLLYFYKDVYDYDRVQLRF